MRLEKIIYSFFGILVMILACFTLSNIMSNTVYRKIHQFGILKVIGFSQKYLQKLTLQYTFVSGLISIIVGVLLTYIFIYLNSNFHILNHLFNEVFFIEFPIKLGFLKVIITTISGILIIILSGYYSTHYAGKMKLIESITYLK